MLINNIFKIKKPILIIFCIFFLIGVQDYVRYAGKIYPGVYVKDMHLGHKTGPEAERALRDLQMVFKGPDESETLLLREMGVELTYDQIVFSCLRKGRNHPWPLNCLERVQLRKGVQVPLSYCIVEEKFARAIGDLQKSFEREAQDACYDCRFDTLTPERFGYRILVEELAWDIAGSLDQTDAGLAVVVPVKELPPGLTMEDLAKEGVTSKMASFTTSFDASNINRTHNIALAAKGLDQLLIAPGQVFSFNGILGDTTLAKGYREGIIIQGGKYVAGVGGGVCQVASTLYNVALITGLKIMERHHHYFETGYVCPGRDATVFYGSRDLKFINTCEHTILLSARVEKDEITIAMAGRPLQEKIEIITRQKSFLEPYLLIEETCELGPGEVVNKGGTPGGRVEVWRAITYAGGEKTEELLSVDNYMPYPAVMRKGVPAATENP